MSKILKLNGFQYSNDLFFNGFPTSISLEVTNKCNLKCMHCSHTYRSKMITGDILEGVFEKIRPHLGNEIKNISLNGLGESLISTQWDYILNTCLDTDNLGVGFITNGIIPLELTNKLFTSNLNITFSIDGASASSYRNIRKVDAFDRVITNIKSINEYKRKKNSDYPIMNAIFVVTVHNMREMTEFILLANRIGLDNVIFTHLVAHFESQLINYSAFFRQEDHDRYLSQVLQEAEKLGVKVVHMGKFNKSLNSLDGQNTIWLYRNDMGEVKCGMIENWCMVNYNAHIQVCCTPDSLIAGDLRENSLLEIWNGATYRKLKTGISHSFEKTCGNRCNLRQSLSLNDVRSFWCELHETYDYDPKKVIKQSYNVVDINNIYLKAVAALQNGDTIIALRYCDDILKIEPLAFEVVNLKGIILAMSGKKEKAASCFLHSFEIFKDYQSAIFNLKKLFQDIEIS